MLRDFSHRSADRELMDGPNLDYAEFDDCLRTLEFINICTLAYRPTLQWIRQISTRLPGKELAVIDVGSGGGDMLRCIWKWALKKRFIPNLSGVDINPYSKQSAERCTPAYMRIHYVTADLFSLNLQNKPDAIINSLFAHHLTDKELIQFIQWMDTQCLIGWHINDLHRHPIPYYFIKWVTWILPISRLVKHDAAVSVARAFTKADWKKLLKVAGIPEEQYAIQWHFPFRYSVSCLKI